MPSARFRLFRARRASPVRVAVDLTRFGRGGVHGGLKPHVCRFLQWIAEARGDRFSFVYLTHSSLVPEIEALRRDRDWQVCAGLSEDCPPPGGGRPGLVWAPDARKAWIERWPVDLLYVPWGFSDFCHPGLPMIQLVADTLHRDRPDLLPPEEVARREAWFRAALARADEIHCISRFTAAGVRRHFGFPEGRIVTIPVAVQDRLTRFPASAPKAGPERPYFIFPAADWPHKNHRGLLEAYAIHLRRSGPEAWDLALTGHFARPELIEAQMAELGIAGRCRRLGYADLAELALIFRAAGALVFPSLYEGFGVPVLEAMALGVPVACSRAGSLPEVAGEAALFFDPGRPEDIADALGRIASDPALRVRLIAAGRRRAEDFSLDREAGRLAERLEAVGARR